MRFVNPKIISLITCTNCRNVLYVFFHGGFYAVPERDSWHSGRIIDYLKEQSNICVILNKVFIHNHLTKGYTK